jgi:ribose-phosphate pyrophosphokinase
MISTGATIEAAARIALAHHAAPPVTVAAIHGLLVGDAAERLHALPLHRLVVTDTTTPPGGPPSWVDLRSVDRLLADAIDRLHRDQPLDELLLHT